MGPQVGREFSFYFMIRSEEILSGTVYRVSANVPSFMVPGAYGTLFTMKRKKSFVHSFPSHYILEGSFKRRV